MIWSFGNLKHQQKGLTHSNIYGRYITNSKMRVEKDFKEFIELLNKNEVRYLIVGGFAYSFYAEPRFTKDIDFFIEPSAENAEKILKVLEEFGFKSLNIKSQDFQEPDQIIQLGNAPLRIDLITSIKGVVFAAAWKNRTEGHYGKIPTYFISKADLIKNKKALSRPQDIADIEKLIKI